MQIILEGLLLGLSTGAYCMGTCMVFFMPYLMAEGKTNIIENTKRVFLFMLGRLVAYLGFALLIGFLGAEFKGAFPARLSHVGLIVVSLMMLVYAVTRNFKESKHCQGIAKTLDSRRIPFILGLLLGLNPCMPFLVGAARVWTLGNVYLGVVLFGAFFLGTSVYVIPLIFVSYLNQSERIRHIGLLMIFIASIYFLIMGVLGLI